MRPRRPKVRYLRKAVRSLSVLAFFAAVIWLIVALDRFNETGADALSGKAYVSDGDTLRIAGVRVRLLGIDAPELKQSCVNTDGDDWPCGQAARDLMMSLVANTRIQCTGDTHDRYHRLLAHCSNGQVDLGAEMVRNGLALGEADYLVELTEARTRKKGMWSGDFVTPRIWRDTNDNKPSSPSDLIDSVFRMIFG